MSLISVKDVFEQCREFTDFVALVGDDQQLTYGQLIERVEHTSQWLQSMEASVVAIMADNSVDWVILDLAAQLADIVCLPIPLFFSKQQIEHCLLSAGVDLLVSEQGRELIISSDLLSCPLESFVAQKRAVNTAKINVPASTGKITFTSGSTGSPKGVCLSNRHLWQVAQSLADTIDIKRPRHLCLLPLATLLENIAGVYAPLLCGGCVYVLSGEARGFSGSTGLIIAKICQTISAVEPTTLITIPQLLSAMIVSTQQWQPPSSLAFVAVGGARVDPDLLITAAEVGLPAFEGYGLSECASVVALNSPSHKQLGSAGKILPHCQVSIENDEVVVRDSCFLGYLGKPETWYSDRVYTGDIGNLSSENYLTISGRKKNQIITSFGRNISPEWVESVLLSKPLLTHCVVSGEAKSFLVALVGADDSISDNDIERWIATANEKLPDYARVLKFIRVPSARWQYLLTANGRAQRQVIEKLFQVEIENLYHQSVSEEIAVL